MIWDKDNLCEYQNKAAEVLTHYESFCPAPEFIPLKCQLYSDLLVQCAENSLETKSHQPAKKGKPPPQLQQAWQHLKKCFNIWKLEGKPKVATNPSFLRYKKARANFHHVRRYHLNLKTIKTNNLVMHTNISEKNKHFKLLKNLRGSKSKQKLTGLYTTYKRCRAAW